MTWTPVPGWPYAVEPTGTYCLDVNAGEVFTPDYLVTLRDGDRVWRTPFIRVMALAFYGPSTKHAYCLDGNHDNRAISNIAYMSSYEYQELRTGRRPSSKAVSIEGRRFPSRTAAAIWLSQHTDLKPETCRLYLSFRAADIGGWSITYEE